MTHWGTSTLQARYFQATYRVFDGTGQSCLFRDSNKSIRIDLVRKYIYSCASSEASTSVCLLVLAAMI